MQSFSMLDDANISAHIISSILIGPYDYKPGNLMVKYKQNKGFLIGIDNDKAGAILIVRLRKKLKGVKKKLFIIPE